MTDIPSHPSFGRRLRSALASLVLALLNATLLLFVVAAVLGLVLIGKVRNLASEVTADVTRAAIASTGLQPADALAELRIISGEMRDLRVAIEQRRGDVDAATAALAARLDRVESTLDSLRERKLELTDAAIEKATLAAGSLLTTLRDCRTPDAGP